MDVVFLNAHDSVVEGCASVNIGSVGVKVLEIFFQEIDRDDTLLSLGGTMEGCEALLGPIVEVGFKLVVKNLQDLEIAKESGEVDSFDSSLRADSAEQILLVLSRVGAFSHHISVEVVQDIW